MAPLTEPTPAAPASPRRSSALTAALTLGAVALVAAGAAWAGRASVQRAPAPAAPATPAAAVAAPQAGAASGLPPETQALLDGGNAAFRGGQYDVALARYREAAARAPRHAAPWIGIQMAAQKLGRTALADSAVAAVRARTDAPGVWNDSAMRVAHDSARGGIPTPSAIPPGHP